MARNNLLRTIPESRKHFESLRGKHKRKGKLWFPNLTAHLEEYEETSRWWDQAEFLSLTSIYCERRNRGHTLVLEGAGDLAKAVRASSKLSSSAKFRFYRLLACPLLTHDTAQYRFQRLWSRENLEKRDRCPDFCYSKANFLWFASMILPVVEAAGKTIAPALHDCLVTAWLEFHKEIWSTNPETYSHNLTLANWNNQHRTEFIEHLITTYDEYDRNEDLAMPSWVGLTRTQHLERGLKVIQALAANLHVSIEDIELERVFQEFLLGHVTAEALPTKVSVWKGVQDKAFSESVNALLNKPKLLKLIAPEHALDALLDKNHKGLLIDLLEPMATEDDIDALATAFEKLGLSLERIPNGSVYKFTGWDDLLCDKSGRYSYSVEPNPEADEKLRGIKALILEMTDPWGGAHNKIGAQIKAWIDMAEKDLDQLLQENLQHIKATRRLFDKVASMQEHGKERKLNERGITIEKLEIPSERRDKLRLPKMAAVMIQEMQERIRAMISEKISELIDGDWRVLATTGINFDD